MVKKLNAWELESSWQLTWSCRLQYHTAQLQYFITVLRACGSVLQGCSTVNVSTADSMLSNDKPDQGPVSRSILLVCSPYPESRSSRLLKGTQQSSNTCHSEKIVLHSSRMSKQPKGLKQYHKSKDFIYSFNTRIGSSSQSHPWGLWGWPIVS